jgi:hypothetical protein
MRLIPFGVLSAAGVGAGPSGASSYELIESSILTSNASNVTFSSIPQDFKHLQIRAVWRSSSTQASTTDANIRLNGDSGANYATHFLSANGSTVISTGVTSSTFPFLGFETIPRNDQVTGNYGGLIADILDYSSTVKNTTIRSFSGSTDSDDSGISLASALWMNTAAVTSMTLFSSGILSGSRFSLYGIRG